MVREYSGIRENEWGLGKFTFHMVKQRGEEEKEAKRWTGPLVFVQCLYGD